MADFTFAEKHKLEKLLGMGGGYVLDFSNRTFCEFVYDSTGKNIYDDEGRYGAGGDSKANRLRTFWKVESNHVVGKLVSDLVEHARERATDRGEAKLVEDCRRIADRLRQGAPVLELEAITPQSAERDLEVLAGQIKTAIDSNQPEAGLDRLHTFVVNYVRRRCDQRGIAYDRDEPLHSLFGKYRKSLETGGHVESEMGKRILKSVIATLDAFNDVRNNRSLAHDNPLLNYDEALLICNHVCSMVRFLNAVEAKAAQAARQQDDSIPF